MIDPLLAVSLLSFPLHPRFYPETLVERMSSEANKGNTEMGHMCKPLGASNLKLYGVDMDKYSIEQCTLEKHFFVA